MRDQCEELVEWLAAGEPAVSKPTLKALRRAGITGRFITKFAREHKKGKGLRVLLHAVGCEIPEQSPDVQIIVGSLRSIGLVDAGFI